MNIWDNTQEALKKHINNKTNKNNIFKSVRRYSKFTKVMQLVNWPLKVIISASEKLREFDHNPEKFEELIIQPICLEPEAWFS